ncbi:hypothetical protein B6U98_04110 [Thermoplasmatales archaeon ex4572_165]|nr:MAG: hypothetical protein B6U98_04110 [Thermoplasmatales archaeon ex4572_165]RLF58693.1 MAG: hypothetical protein DRN27_04700 [Thermoplasmata archaeon]
MNDLQIYLLKFGSPEFNLTCEFREGAIDGPIIKTKTYPPSEIPAAWIWFFIDYEDYDVIEGLDYFVVLPPVPSDIITSFGYEWDYAFGSQIWPGSFWFTRDGSGL